MIRNGKICIAYVQVPILDRIATGVHLTSGEINFDGR